jgi:toxin ParE1/3/4
MEIRWLDRAVAELNAIHDFIASDNPTAATLTARRIDAAVNLLAEQPSLGRPGRVPGTRELVVSGTPYLVAYSVLVGTIIILSVQHGARRWPSLF